MDDIKQIIKSVTKGSSNQKKKSNKAGRGKRSPAHIRYESEWHESRNKARNAKKDAAFKDECATKKPVCKWTCYELGTGRLTFPKLRILRRYMYRIGRRGEFVAVNDSNGHKERVSVVVNPKPKTKESKPQKSDQPAPVVESTHANKE